MKSGFELAMQFVGLHEWGNRPDGGYTNNPLDPGGETKFGISKRAHPNEDIKNLTLERALEIYRAQYWDFYNVESLGLSLSVAAFDSYVQHSPKAVRRFLDIARGDVKKFLEQRRAYYLSLNNPTFIKGWLNRVNDLSKFVDILSSD